MPFSRPTLQSIIDRIEADIVSRLNDNSALARTSLLRILARVMAGGFHIAYGYLELIAKQLFPDQAQSDYLDDHGVIWGVTRQSASFATGNIKFVGVNGTSIPSGTAVQDANGVEFETTALGTISGGQAIVAATASSAGDFGNIEANDPLQLISSVSGINSIEANADFSGGADAETDTAYRARILYRIREQPTGGTEADYIRWAKEVSGVADAWTIPLEYGNGSVSIDVKASGSNPEAGSTLLDSVETYIDARMPLGTALYVHSIAAMDIAFNISITPNTTDLQTAIDENMEQLFDTDAEPGGTLYISRMRNAIMSAGVDNYEITAMSVNSVPVAVDDITLPNPGYHIFDSITYATL